MKSLIILALGITFNALAGDLYLICSTNYGSSDQDEIFLLDKALDGDRIINGSFYDPENIDHMIDVTLTPQTRNLSVIIYDVHGGGSRGSLQAKLDINRPKNVTDVVSCRISD